MITALPRYSVSLAAPPQAPAATAPPATDQYSGRSTWEVVKSKAKSAAVCTLVMGGTAALGSHYGFWGAVGGVTGSGLLAATNGDRNIMVPFTVLMSGIAGTVGCLGGPWGAGVMAGLSFLYGLKCG